MYARLNTIEGLPDRMDDATRHAQEQTLPQLRQMDGFKGFVALGDRQSGRLVGVAFWESEEALRATEPFCTKRSFLYCTWVIWKSL
jgi:heme-degrading monooxygenase HmoA